MMLKCTECGEVFDRPDVWTENGGEEFSGCPSCGGYYEEAVQCEKCGRWLFAEEKIGGLCEDCADDLVYEHKYDVKKCFDVAENESAETVKINALLHQMFTEEQINEILFNELLKCSYISPVDCTRYIEQDKDWFVEQAQKIKKEKNE